LLITYGTKFRTERGRFTAAKAGAKTRNGDVAEDSLRNLTV
jgi:hypothetical protein